MNHVRYPSRVVQSYAWYLKGDRGQDICIQDHRCIGLGCSKMAIMTIEIYLYHAFFLFRSSWLNVINVYSFRNNATRRRNTMLYGSLWSFQTLLEPRSDDCLLVHNQPASTMWSTTHVCKNMSPGSFFDPYSGKKSEWVTYLILRWYGAGSCETWF